MIKILHRDTGAVLCEVGVETLAGAELAGRYLACADLQKARLAGANLQAANLREANLRGADLRRATLRNADLTGAKLSGAHLKGADLSGAILRRVSYWSLRKALNRNSLPAPVPIYHAMAGKSDAAKRTGRAGRAPERPVNSQVSASVGSANLPRVIAEKVRKERASQKKAVDEERKSRWPWCITLQGGSPGQGRRA